MKLNEKTAAQQSDGLNIRTIVMKSIPQKIEIKQSKLNFGKPPKQLKTIQTERRAK